MGSIFWLCTFSVSEKYHFMTVPKEKASLHWIFETQDVTKWENDRVVEWISSVRSSHMNAFRDLIEMEESKWESFLFCSVIYSRKVALKNKIQQKTHPRLRDKMKITADIQWLPLFDSIKDLRNQQTEFIERGGEDSGQQNEERFCFFIFGRFYSGDSESLYENLPEESI